MSGPTGRDIATATGKNDFILTSFRSKVFNFVAVVLISFKKKILELLLPTEI